MTLSLPDAITKVNGIFDSYPAAAPAGPAGPLVPAGWLEGKVYEAWVLTVLLNKLSSVEGFSVTLVGGQKAQLKSGGGPINPNYPRFLLSRPGGRDLEIWTDIEFSTLSFAHAQMHGTAGPTPSKGHKHELDLVVVPAGTTGYPSHGEVVIGVECKNTQFEKNMARAALGVRRELSYLTDDVDTLFASWPRSEVPAKPPSVLMVFSTHPAVADYDEAGQVFGVDFIYEQMI